MPRVGTLSIPDYAAANACEAVLERSFEWQKLPPDDLLGIFRAGQLGFYSWIDFDERLEDVSSRHPERYELITTDGDRLNPHLAKLFSDLTSSGGEKDAFGRDFCEEVVAINVVDEPTGWFGAGDEPMLVAERPKARDIPKLSPHEYDANLDSTLAATVDRGRDRRTTDADEGVVEGATILSFDDHAL